MIYIIYLNIYFSGENIIYKFEQNKYLIFIL